MAASFAERAAEKTRALPPSGRRIGTHNGSFHCDEALACWLLHQMPEYAGAAVVRTRDEAVFPSLDILVDVGGVYDPERQRFDHHQRGFFETADGVRGQSEGGRWKTKLSSAGLVYKHFGRKVIEHLAGTQDAETELIWAEVYENYIEGIDAIDNGIEVCDGQRRYKEGSDLSSRVSRLNARWNEVSDDDDQCRRFERASALCGAEFLDVLSTYVDSWLPARAKVAEALAGRVQVHSSGQVIVLESGGLPWRDHVYGLEREAGVEGLVKFVLYKDQAELWRVQAVTVEGTLFTNRLSLLEPWWGLRGEALVKASGISGCSFVHATGFIGGNATYEGALAMATAALQSQP